jgi:PAS domain S-box-containing protein
LGKTSREIAHMPAEDVQKLVHELQVHQIELEMQNDELRRAQQELEAARDRYADLFDFAPTSFLTLDASGKITAANLAAGGLLGLDRSDLIHKKFTRFVAVEARDDFHLYQRRVLNSNEKSACELDLLTSESRRLTVQVQGIATNSPEMSNARWRLTLNDITEPKRAEERIARLNRVQAILGGVDRAIVHIPDRQKLLDEICRVSVEKGGFKLAWIGMVSLDGSVQPVAQAGATRYLDGIRVVTRDEPEGRGPVGTAIRENRPVVIEDVDRDARMAPWRDQALKFGLYHTAAFPIRIAGKVTGSFQVYASQADFFDEEELGLLTQVSNDISFALTSISGQAARKRAEEALRRSEHNLSVFFNRAPIGMAWLSASGTILRTNQAQLDLLGYPAKDYLGHFFNDFSVDPSQGRELLTRLAAKEMVGNFQMTVRCKNGAIRHVVVNASPSWSNGEFQYSSIFLRDVTDRIALENEILQAGEREHQRIARDIHNGLGQLLVGTAYMTNTLQKDLAAKSLPEARQSRRILKVIYEAIAQTRNLARGLRPVKPESNGLMAALKALAVRTKTMFRVECRFSCRRPVLIEDNAIATHLFRIAQEAVTNAIKHGRSGRIEISLAKTPERINLVVRGNGPSITARNGKKPGMGMRIMRYRAGMIGGSFAIRKEAGGGTAVVCSIHPSGQDISGGHKPATGRKK